MREHLLWGLEASPYLLKLEAMLRFAGQRFRRLPAEGGRWENLRTSLRLSRARRRGQVSKYPQLETGLDEYPAVPYLCVHGREFMYDTSGIARWLDAEAGTHPTLFPAEPGLAFLAQLIDEAFDEYGLYMVHHQRWVSSAADTTMPEVSAREFSRLLPRFMAERLRRQLPRRQVRRCPYLFSVAPEGFDAGVAPGRTPPARAGFPETHSLLDQSWLSYLQAMETLLGAQPYLLGERFTVADASAYGQLSMNLIDPTVRARLAASAPTTLRWLTDIRDGKHAGDRGQLYLSDSLSALLRVIMQTFAPLMRQNATAWRAAVANGQTLFNEAAFDRGEALYDGELLGRPFRAVIKSFQVPVWRDLCLAWQALDDRERDTLRPLLPGCESFGETWAIDTPRPLD